MDKKVIFESNSTLLRWTGFWPSKNGIFTCGDQLRCCTFILMNIMCILLPEICYIYENANSMIEISQCISEALSILLALIKMVLILFYRRKIHKLIGDMREAWHRCSEFTDKEWTDIRLFTEKQSSIMSYVYVTVYVGFGCNFMLNPLIMSIVQIKINNENITAAHLPTPIKFSYPFDFRTNIQTFLIIYAMGYVSVFTTIFILSAFDALYLSLINYCAIFFKYTNCKIKKRLCVKYPDTVHGKLKAMHELGQVVRDHNQAIDFVNRLEEVANLNMIVQYLCSSFLFCVVGFQLSVFMQNLYEFFRVSTYLLCLNMQLFTFSLFGTKLMTESANVAIAAYGCLWFNQSLSFQKSVKLIMSRSQRDVGVTAAKFYYICFESFARVLSTSISYFTLLQTIYVQ